MVSFVEFVVSEWKGRRLSRADAAELIRQFSERRQGGGSIHPLLHENVSDLSRQAFRSTWRGTEPFLADHRVVFGGRPVPVLPAAACLEAIHAAVERATPHEERKAVVEIRHAAWIAPLIVDGTASLMVTVSPGEDGTLEIDMLSGEGDDVQVHCQASAAWIDDTRPPPVSLDAMARDMPLPVDPADMYERFTAMGLHYGPSHRTVVALHRGPQGALARLARYGDPGQADMFHMPPGVLDGALQAAFALTDETSRPHLPFAVEQVRVFAALPREVWAWVKPGQSTDAGIHHVDIDLLDDEGRCVVSLRALSSRPMAGDGRTTSPCPWQEHATYLVAHGLDAAGASLAEAILRRTRHTRLLLVAHEPADAHRMIKAITSGEERIAYLPPAAIDRQTVSDLAGKGYPLRGVLHVVTDSPAATDLAHIDDATAGAELDFLAVVCSPGIDTDEDPVVNGFVSRRDDDKEKGHRHGLTLSLGWRQGRIESSCDTGDVGQAIVEALGAALSGANTHAVVDGNGTPSAAPVETAPAVAEDTMRARLRDHLRREFAAVLKLRADRIDSRASLDDYGVDSIVAMKLTRRIESSFGPQPKTLLFEYRDLDTLAAHLAQTHPM